MGNRTTGIRFYEWQVDAIPVFTFFDSDFSNAPGSEKDNDQLYKFQLNYDIKDGSFVYGVVSQGFRTGGFNAGVNPAVGFPDEFSRWSPDHLTNYELGLKTVLSDGRIQFNSAVYIMRWDDVISVVANEAGNFFINANVPDLEASGFETEVVTQDLFGVGFYAAATFSYTENEFKSDAAVFDGAPTNIRQGDELRRTPKNTWSFDLGYDFTLANTDAYIRANYWHRSSTSTRGFDGGDGDIKVPAHDVVNMSAGMNWQSWALKFYVSNVTNERPLLQIFPSSVDSTLPAVASSIRPRTVGLAVSFGSHD